MWSTIKTNLDPLDETKLNLKDNSVLKITILHNISPPLENASSSMQKDVIHIN